MVDEVFSAACCTTRQTTKSWPYLCDSQELALCIGSQIKEEAFMACPHYLASCLCLCDCGWGWSWPYYRPAACHCCLHHHNNCIQCCTHMLCTHSQLMPKQRVPSAGCLLTFQAILCGSMLTQPCVSCSEQCMSTLNNVPSEPCH